MVQQLVTWCSICFVRDNVREPGESIDPIPVPGARKPQSLDVCEPHRKEFVEPFMLMMKEYGTDAEGTPRKSRAAAAPAATPRTAATPAPASGDEPRVLADDEPLVCKVTTDSGTCGKDFTYRKAFAQHVERKHKLKMPEYVATYGDPGQRKRGRRVQSPVAAPPSTEAGLFEDAPAPPEAPVVTVTEKRPVPETDVVTYKCGVGDCTVSYSTKDNNRPSQSIGVHRWQAHGIKAEKSHANTAKKTAAKKTPAKKTAAKKVSASASPFPRPRTASV